LINIGAGEDLTIRELAEMVCEVLGFDGELVFDTTRLDGTPQKFLDVSRMRDLGWHGKTSLPEGIRLGYEAQWSIRINFQCHNRFQIPTGFNQRQSACEARHADSRRLHYVLKTVVHE
jgi:hypothetical protein